MPSIYLSARIPVSNCSLRFKTEQEQQIWNECGHLLTNCIIYYNATLLSNLLAHKEKTGDPQGAALIKQVSPVA